ncbi:MAG: metal-dependent transcriptional regulator [Clostridia bacterium]|nr:metal-dependent transcriptional regulator [Clostridia bacterium]
MIDKGCVRSVAVADAPGVSKPTVSRFLKGLVDEGYISTSDNRAIELTQQGLVIADEIIERHNIILDLLIGLGVERAVACEMEHIISPQCLAAFKAFAGRNPL